MARIWEPYLTDADKAHLAVSKDRRVGFGSKPALLLIDLYRAVFGDKPEPMLESIKLWPSSHGMAGWNALPHIQQVLEALQISTIVPPKIVGAAVPYLLDHGIGPRHGRQTSHPISVRGLHARVHVVCFERVASRTS
jgi:hypothetical protein